MRRKPKRRRPTATAEVQPWLCGPVPNGFWTDAENRRAYLLWLARKKRFKKMEDWYRITADDFEKNHGGGVFANYWRGSPIEALKDCFPDREWLGWLFGQAPSGFWSEPQNHRRYVEWLAAEKGIKCPEDWYKISGKDFEQNCGRAMLALYNSSPVAVVKAYLPGYPWMEWLFSGVPHGFWLDRKNRVRYMDWLGEQLGFKKPEDWYAVINRDFHRRRGYQFLKHFNGSPLDALRDYLPNYEWKEWLFYRVPSHFWDESRNRRRYMDWLGKELGYRRPADWLKARHDDFVKNNGERLLLRYDSYLDLLKEYLPQFDWRARAIRRR
jgi:hypothetical protein